MEPIALSGRHLPPDVCRICERRATRPELLCACHICMECHAAFWGNLECVKTTAQRQANIERINRASPPRRKR